MRKEFVIVAAVLAGFGFRQQSAAQTAPAEPTPAEAPSVQRPQSEAPPVPAAPVATPPSPSAPVPRNVIYLSQEASYVDASTIDREVLATCFLPRRGAELIEITSRAAGYDMIRDENAVKARKGRVLQVEIVDIVSYRGGLVGHLKMVLIRGRLYEDGNEISSFFARRRSTGGLVADREACPVLWRCLEALARDVTQWLKYPTLKARLGD